MNVLTIPLTPEQKKLIREFAIKKGYGNCSSFTRSLVLDYIDKNSYNIKLTEQDFQEAKN